MLVSPLKALQSHIDEAGGGYQKMSSNHVSEITEEEEEDEYSSDLFEINHGVPMASIREECETTSLFSFDIHEDCVYVAIGKGESSVDALSWALMNAVNPASTTVYLVHVFPETHLIPSPLGKLPKNQVSPEMVNNYMAQQRGKRREFLQKFINMCSASQVKVDTILVESDMVGKAILDLIPILNMRKLVVGTPKSNLRKLKSGKGSGIADQLLVENEMEGCQIKIVCEGKEVIIDQMTDSDQLLPNSPQDYGSVSDHSNKSMDQKKQEDDEENSKSISCLCFKTKF